MESPDSTLSRRTISFNPEAAAFNPVFSSPIQQDIEDGPLAAPTPPEAFKSISMVPMFNSPDSPFQGSVCRYSPYHGGQLTPAPVRLEDFLSPDAQALVNKLEEHPEVQEICSPHTPTQKFTQAAHTAAGPTAHPPSFKFPLRQPQPEYNAVDINELSAGLGLPALQVDNSEDASPAASQMSRPSPAHPGALYGKLIGRALNKPLTAKGLAEYLQNQDLHTHSDMPALTESPLTITVHQKPEIVHTPPRPAQTRGLASTPIDTSKVPKGQSAVNHQHRRSSNSSASFRHHARNPSTRRYPRRTSRAKRLDQGPMPSSADIYPDDANWTPSVPIYEGYDYMAYHNQPVDQPQVIVDNAFNWPTPAQVYQPELAPTADDIGAADNDVLALLGELPEPSLDTLLTMGASGNASYTTASDLPCDSRALSPAQLDGSRYGLKFYGIGLGDEWELRQVGDFSQNEPFRVRPRDHDGWGGWEWALRNGWCA